MSSAAIQIITWLSCILLLIGFTMYLKRRFQKAVIGKVECEFITREGNGFVKLYPVEHGLVEIPMKRDGEGKCFAIDASATYLVDYPANYPGFLQAKVKKAVLHIGSWEPLSKKPETKEWKKMEPVLVNIATLQNKAILSPEMLYNMKNEMFSELAVAYSRDLKDMQEQLAKQVKPATLYIMVGACILGVLGLAYYMFQTMPEIIEGIEAIKAGMGV